MSSTVQLTQKLQKEIKELPHNAEAEQGLLGAILLNNDIADEVNSIIDSNHFFEEIHKRIYEVVNRLIAKGQLATPVTLKSYFEVEKTLEEIGGSSYLARLANAAVSLEYAKNYAQIIYDLAVRRNLYILGGNIEHSALESDIDINPSELIETAEKELYQISEKGSQLHAMQNFSNSLEGAMVQITKAYENDSSVTGISTGFVDLDQKLGGLHPSDLLILAGRPSMGKTSLATNIAFNIAKKAYDTNNKDSNVAFFSLEMSAEQLATRVLSEQAKISSNEMRKGNLSESDLDTLVSTSHKIVEMPLFIDDTPATNQPIGCACPSLETDTWARLVDHRLPSAGAWHRSFRKPCERNFRNYDGYESDCQGTADPCDSAVPAFASG